jgi:hypothetical protein
MPWRGYIICVGSALLLLIFAIDGLMPRTAFSAPSKAEVELPPIRIRSEAKGPEAVIIDTSHATPPAASDREVAASEPASLPHSESEAQFGQAVAQLTDRHAANAGASAAAPAGPGLEAFAQVRQPGWSAFSKPRAARPASPARGKGHIGEAGEHRERFGF